MPSRWDNETESREAGEMGGGLSPFSHSSFAPTLCASNTAVVLAVRHRVCACSASRSQTRDLHLLALACTAPATLLIKRDGQCGNCTLQSASAACNLQATHVWCSVPVGEGVGETGSARILSPPHRHREECMLPLCLQTQRLLDLTRCIH